MATQYVNTLNWWLRSSPRAITHSFGNSNYQLFTSDYSLYWYDYEAGYDTVFGRITMNYSRQINIDLCRGAATVQNKDWGVMITWTYTQPPYMESYLTSTMTWCWRMKMEQNTLLSLIVTKTLLRTFYNKDNLMRCSSFGSTRKSTLRSISPVSERSAYVLPDGYAYGFRSPTDDSIWGLWRNDSVTLDISMTIGTLFQIFGNNLDIVYPEANQTLESVGYKNVIYWNDTRLIPTLPPTQSPDFQQTAQSTLSPRPEQDAFLPAYVVAVSVLIGVVVGGSVFKFKMKRR